MSNTKNVMSQAANVYDGPTYVSDVFQAHHYVGNGYNDRRFVNGINLEEHGGMFLAKQKNANDYNRIWDSVTGLHRHRITSSSNPDSVITQGFGNVNDLQFHTDGFTLSNNVYFNQLGSGNKYANWIWRRSPGFFDIVEYTGTNATQTIPHNLQCKPGMIWVKAIDENENWQIFHSAQPNTPRQYHFVMGGSAVVGPNTTIWANTDPDENNFYVGYNSIDTDVNTRGKRYIAYLWAEGSDSGAYRFGENGDEHIIRCGAYIAPTSAPTEVNLGFQPQALIIKHNNGQAHWHIGDELIGTGGNGFSHDYTNNVGDTATNLLSTNAQITENIGWQIEITANGFRIPDSLPVAKNTLWNNGGDYYVYCAIRRNDMKTPEKGTEVFKSFRGGNLEPIEVGFAPDWIMRKDYSAIGTPFASIQRATGARKNLRTDNISAMGSGANYGLDSSTTFDNTNSEQITWAFKRARRFMDIQMYTADGSATSQPHNLGVKPELVMVKQTQGSGAWIICGEALDKIVAQNLSISENYAYFQSSSDASYSGITNYRGSVDTATTFGIRNDVNWNTSQEDYLAWLFASVPGVCKIGSYSHAGGELTIDCGFTTGARFILVKKVFTTSPFFIFDTANGIGVNYSRFMEMDDGAAAFETPATVKPHPSGFTVLDNGYISRSTFLYMAIS